MPVARLVAEAAAYSQPVEALAVVAAGSRPQAEVEVALACSRLEVAQAAGWRPGEALVAAADSRPQAEAVASAAYLRLEAA